MLKNTAITVLLSVVATTAAARGYIHIPAQPEPLAAGTSVADTLPPLCTEVRYEMRVAPAPGHTQKWGVDWGVRGDTCRRIVLTSRPAGHGDNLYDDEIEVMMAAIEGGCVVDSAIYTLSKHSPVRNGGRGDAVILIADGSSCRIHLSDHGVYHTFAPVEFDMAEPGGIRAFALTDGVATLRRELTFEAADSVDVAPFGSVDELVDSLGAMSDPVAGVWSYLDRAVEGSMASLQARYRVAVVPDGADCYSIVYLEGMRRANGVWRPLTVKGRLEGGRWANHYDLRWRDARGSWLSDDVDAYCTVDVEAGVMTLEFPGLKSSVRLKRER